MAMNVPTWGNKGVSPSDERKQEGYSAGQCLPANHLNWFLNQIFTNLEDAKQQLTNLTAQSGNNNTYINSVKTKLDKLVANMPVRAVYGQYSGTGTQQTINIGATPSVVFVKKQVGSEYSYMAHKNGAVMQGDGTPHIKVTTNGFIADSYGNSSGNVYLYAALIEY